MSLGLSLGEDFIEVTCLKKQSINQPTNQPINQNTP